MKQLRLSDHPNGWMDYLNYNDSPDNGKFAREFVRRCFESLDIKRYKADRGYYVRTYGD
jgi:hypothetical protein